MNEIVKFTSDTGQAVEITPQDVRNVLCPQANDKEIALFLELCKAQRLNPWVKDAYLVKYGNSPASIITGKETFTKRANANKKYQGFEAGVTYINARGEVCQREGSAVYRAAKETLVGGWCRVFVEGRKPFYDEVTIEEYSTGKSNWQKMPATMIRKVALVHCLREAFPEDFQGLYAAEEMGNAGEQAMQRDAAPAPVPVKQSQPMAVEFVEMASEEQNAEIVELVAELAEKRGKTSAAVFSGIYGAKSIIAAGIEAGRELTAQQAGLVVDLLHHWLEQAEQSEVVDAYEAEEAAQVAEAAQAAEYVEPELYDQDVPF